MRHPTSGAPLASKQAILTAVAGLERTVSHTRDRRAPHKPLLLLLAIAALRRSGSGRLSFDEVEDQLRPLLDRFAPPVKGTHQPQLPYWHLRTDGLWIVDGADELPMQKGGFPLMAPLRQTTGHLPADVSRALTADPGLLTEVVERVLADHFPESLHQDILDAIGRDLDEAAKPARAADSAAPRDPTFRQDVLRAYGHRCALTGFHAQLRGAHLGLEAAHLHWHSHGGPDRGSNGLALQSTMHKCSTPGRGP